MGAVTCITSGKGGVGKSSLCAGLGAALTKRGRRVLLIDGDAGLPALDVFLSCAEERVYDIADVIAGRASIKDALYSCPWAEGLWLLPAPSREEDCISPLLMKQVADLLIPYYDHILIDCPAGLGTGFQSASSAAQRALVVATPDPVCIRASAKTRLELEAAGISQQRLVINRFRAESFRSQKVFPDLDAVIDSAGIRLIAVIPEDGELPSCEASGTPLPSHSKAALAFDRLAARLEGEQIPLAPLHKF